MICHFSAGWQSLNFPRVLVGQAMCWLLKKGRPFPGGTQRFCLKEGGVLLELQNPYPLLRVISEEKGTIF